MQNVWEMSSFLHFVFASSHLPTFFKVIAQGCRFYRIFLRILKFDTSPPGPAPCYQVLNNKCVQIDCARSRRRVLLKWHWNLVGSSSQSAAVSGGEKPWRGRVMWSIVTRTASSSARNTRLGHAQHFRLEDCGRDTGHREPVQLVRVAWESLAGGRGRTPPVSHLAKAKFCWR